MNGGGIMFFEALTISGIHLVIMGALAYGKSKPGYLFLAGVLPVFACVIVFSEVLLIQAIVLAVGSLLWRRFAPKCPSIFIATSLIAVTAIYVGVSWHA